jgi:hypothetical protein
MYAQEQPDVLDRILGILALHAIACIVMVNLMLIVSPLAGLALATGGGWNYARVWFFRFVELLATPLIWGATLGFARALMSGFGVDTHPVLGLICTRRRASAAPV